MMEMQLRMSYADSTSALTVYNAIVPDDDGYVTSSIEGNDVVFNLKAANAGQMRSAMDDLLACVKIAEDALGLVSVSASDLDSDSLLE